MRIGWCPAVLAAVALAVSLAGCGSVYYQSATTGGRGRDAGGRALALASARRLLGELVLPAGARQLPSGSLPASLREPFGSGPMGTDSVDLVRLYQLPLPMKSAARFLTGHPAHGTVLGDLSYPQLGMEIDFTPRHVATGLFQTDLINSVVPGPGRTSLLRVDAQATWEPPRSVVEHLVPARFKSVSITATGRRADRASGGQRFIQPLVAALNSLPALPPMVISCPPPIESYRLTFRPAVAGQAQAVVTIAGCLAVEVSIGGRARPALRDTGSLGPLIASLLGLKLP